MTRGEHARKIKDVARERLNSVISGQYSSVEVKKKKKYTFTKLPGFLLIRENSNKGRIHSHNSFHCINLHWTYSHHSTPLGFQPFLPSLSSPPSHTCPLVPSITASHVPSSLQASFKSFCSRAHKTLPSSLPPCLLFYTYVSPVSSVYMKSKNTPLNILTLKLSVISRMKYFSIMKRWEPW